MQTVSPLFNQLANGDIRPISWGARISFSKVFDDDVKFFTLDESTLDGTDLLAPSDDNPIQAWDFYEYVDYTERLVFMSVERSLEFPYSVVSAIADFQLNNYDKYFTPNSSSPISSHILPKRPVRLLQGFSNTTLPQFVGLTEGMPEIDREAGTATFTAMDFLTWIYDMPIRNTIAMRDVTTDEVLANIFEQFGLAPEQYDLARGRNKIPFLFFEREQQKAGDIIRPLMQAEMGMLWLDEQGIIRFRPRLVQPSEPTYLFDHDNIISIDTSEDDQIVNHVTINADVREVQEYQTVYSKTASDTTLHVIPAGGTYVLPAQLSDPCLTIEDPDFGENAGVSWFTAALPDGTPVNSGVSVSLTELKTNTFNVTFSNSNGFAVNIDQLVLWGQPAKRISVEPTIYDAYDDESVAKYGEKVLSIDNNFIQSASQADSLALTLFDEYAEHNDIITMEVKGNPAIQLSDIGEVDYEEFSSEYRIISIVNKTQDAKFTQILKCRKYTPRHWFTLDQSTLNGTDVLAP
jgi:hypothetical protein